jgi:DNA-binding NarL/FixJ family response regulator
MMEVSAMTSTQIGHRRVRVVIVDDDDINRRGMASVLNDASDIEVVAALTHIAAMQQSIRWDFADVVLVDGADERRDDDHFPGVEVVDEIRRSRPTRPPTVIVVSEHYYDDALRRRLREARPDYFHHRSHLHDGEALRRIVLHPERVSSAVPPCVDLETQFRHGVTEYTRVNRAVAFARERRLMELLAARPEPRSRAWLRLRKEFNQEARLNPVTTDGRTPDRPQEDPSLPQISRFLTWATRVKRGHHMPDDLTGLGMRSRDRASGSLHLAAAQR